ncbi:MAG: M6 family metalloprotease domain-containing protein [Muribaculaceae bacterium]|nr:M6 family metalloprotease domain-containing protein [Muribaculaceae bacterium]
MDISNVIKYNRRKAPTSPCKIKISDFPSMGHQKTLVVLVEFENKKFSTIPDAYSFYNSLLNEEGFTHQNGANGSARDYFLKCSDGQFSPEFVVVGPITVSRNYEYYGINTVEALDANVADMVTESCQLIDDLVDFKNFDADNDGYVDNIYFFYAGFGEADSNDYDAIWPHSGYLEENWNRNLILDGKKINRYTCSNEIRYDSAPDFLPVGIGTFVHEFGHVLGLADHYDTRYTSGRSGVNEWDTMAAASYHDNQNTPPLYSAFERAELGWLDYNELNEKQEGPIYIPVLSEENKAYRIKAKNSENEYFVIENRQLDGWDRTLPGHGVLVWHIDIDENAWFSNFVNVDPYHQRVDVVEADNQEDPITLSSDTFPGTLNVTQFKFNSWDNKTLFVFDDVKENEENVRIILGDTSFKPTLPEISISDVYGTSFYIDWSNSDMGDYFFVTVKDSDNLVLPLYDNLKLEGLDGLKVEGLGPLSEYEIEIYSTLGSYKSDIVKLSVSTSNLEFFETIPELPFVKEIVPQDHISIGWAPVAKADKYLVNVYKEDWSSELEVKFDFSEELSLLPEGWSTSSNVLSRSIFGESSPALRLDNDEDFIMFCYDDVIINSLQFYNQTQNTMNNLIIEYYDPILNEWSLIKTLAGQINGGLSEVEIGGKNIIRIKFQKQGGYEIIDDIILKGNKNVLYSLYGDFGEDIGNQLDFTLYTFDSQQIYYFSITAVSNGIQSLPSPLLKVSGAETTVKDTLVSNLQANPIAYNDILGRKIDKDYKGICIIKYSDGTTRKVIIQ